VRPVGATLADVVDAVLASPTPADPFVCEGGTFDLSGAKSTLDL
jgi:hypothetical protein